MGHWLGPLQLHSEFPRLHTFCIVFIKFDLFWPNKQTAVLRSSHLMPRLLLSYGLGWVIQQRSNLFRIFEEACVLILSPSHPLLSSAVFSFWMGSYLPVFLSFQSVEGLFCILWSRKFGYRLHHLLVFLNKHFLYPKMLAKLLHYFLLNFSPSPVPLKVLNCGAFKHCKHTWDVDAVLSDKRVLPHSYVCFSLSDVCFWVGF